MMASLSSAVRHGRGARGQGARGKRGRSPRLGSNVVIAMRRCMSARFGAGFEKEASAMESVRCIQGDRVARMDIY